MRWIDSSTIVIGTCIIALAGIFVAPPITILALVVCIAMLLWERYHFVKATRTLITHLRRCPIETKLEVGTGVWGELCHTLNRLLQQWRTEQHLQRLQLTQPALRQIDPLSLHPPVSGMITPVAVLAIGRLAIADPLAEAQARFTLIREQIASHQALVEWRYDHLLLIFGILHADTDPMKQAISFISATVHTAQTVGLSLPPLSLSSGLGRIGVVPVLGLHFSGEPLEQVSMLIRQTPPGMITCNDEAYFHLRRLGLLPLSTFQSTTIGRGYALTVTELAGQRNAES